MQPRLNFFEVFAKTLHHRDRIALSGPCGDADEWDGAGETTGRTGIALVAAVQAFDAEVQEYSAAVDAYNQNREGALVVEPRLFPDVTLPPKPGSQAPVACLVFQ